MGKQCKEEEDNDDMTVALEVHREKESSDREEDKLLAALMHGDPTVLVLSRS